MHYNPYIQKYERKIISEGVEDNVKSSLQKLFDFVVDIIKKSEEYYGLNVKFLVTWGASLGGMILPLKQWIEGEYPELNEKQIVLLLVGIACNYFYDNEKFIRGILDKIKEEGLEDTFKEVLIKSRNLRDSFFNFMKSANVTLGSTLELVTYSFLIPIITDIQSAITEGSDIQTTAMTIAKRLVASGVVLTGQIALTETIKKIIKKFQ